MPVDLPQWLHRLRRTEVVDRIRKDPRSRGQSALGLDAPAAMQVIDGGQARFDKPFGRFSADDRVLLYAHFNQKGHLEELAEAFRQLFANTAPDDPIVVDLGAGPCTGGLALAATLEPPVFDYIGVDSSSAMRKLGEHLASSAPRLDHVRRTWAGEVAAVEWDRAPGWRPVLVIISYLLASPTLDAAELVGRLGGLLAKLGKGPTTLLYTNSTRPEANRLYPDFAKALVDAGFDKPVDGTGELVVERWAGDRLRKLRYALFHRQPSRKLSLGGG